MSNTLINLSGFQRGVANDETGININTFKCRVEPEFKDKLQGKDGNVRGFCVGAQMLQVTLTGEVGGNTGIMAASTTTATSVSNTTAYFGAPTTGLYMDNGEVEQKRDGFKDVNAEFSANAGVP